MAKQHELTLVVVNWANVSYRFGVFTTEGKAKKFLFKEIKPMKVWVQSIDDGQDQHYMKDDLIAHVDFKKPLVEIYEQISKLLLDTPEHDFQIIISPIEVNEPIEIL